MPKIKIVEINDIHFGIAGTDRLRKELDFFLDFLRTHDLDILELNGDYFNNELSLVSSAALTVSGVIGATKKAPRRSDSKSVENFFFIENFSPSSLFYDRLKRFQDASLSLRRRLVISCAF